MSRHPALAGAGVLAAGLLLSACGGTGYGGTGTSGQSAPTAAAHSGGTTVQLGKTPAGPVLVDARGRTLYAFAADSPGRSRCTGSCLQYWPPDSPPTDTVSQSSGVTADLATIQRSDGARQLTVNGWPAYTYAGDSRPGQAAGQGLDLSGGRWWVLTPTGSQVMSGGGSAGY
jgi:predicted lipoprotein with Yx(FWY)xxD motif